LNSEFQVIQRKQEIQGLWDDARTREKDARAIYFSAANAKTIRAVIADFEADPFYSDAYFICTLNAPTSQLETLTSSPAQQYFKGWINGNYDFYGCCSFDVAFDEKSFHFKMDNFSDLFVSTSMQKMNAELDNVANHVCGFNLDYCSFSKVESIPQYQVL
jgi:hypothetical protein